MSSSTTIAQQISYSEGNRKILAGDAADARFDLRSLTAAVADLIPVRPHEHAMIRIAPLSLTALLLLSAGCATAPVPSAEQRPVVPDRTFAPGLLTPSDGRTARFVIVRDRGSAGSLAGIDVFIDSQKIARLATSDVVTIYATPGRHTLAARFSYGPIGPAERDFVADPQKPVTVRVFTEGNASRLDLRPDTGYSYQ